MDSVCKKSFILKMKIGNCILGDWKDCYSGYSIRVIYITEVKPKVCVRIIKDGSRWYTTFCNKLEMLQHIWYDLPSQNLIELKKRIDQFLEKNISKINKLMLFV